MTSSKSDSIPRVLPRGPHGLPSEVVAASQRGRLLESVAEAVADNGYAKTTVADVIRRAGVSRKAFYVHFQDKSDCFISAFEAGTAMLAERIAAATNAAEGPEAQLRAGYEALCGTLAEHPALARCFTVISPEAGPVARERRDEWREASIERIRSLHQIAAQMDRSLPSELPESTARAIVGGVEALIAHHVQTLGAESLGELAPTIVEIARRLMFCSDP